MNSPVHFQNFQFRISLKKSSLITHTCASENRVLLKSESHFLRNFSDFTSRTRSSAPSTEPFSSSVNLLIENLIQEVNHVVTEKQEFHDRDETILLASFGDWGLSGL